MSEHFTICPEPAKALGARAESLILREALRRNPGSAPLRLKLAKLLNLIDAFDDTIALLSAAPIECLSGGELLALARAFLSSGTIEHDEAAGPIAQQAVRLALSDVERSIALADAAKASFRTGDPVRAIAFVEEALRLDPQNPIACKRLATHWLRMGEPGLVLDLVDRLAARGVAHSRLHASRILALAQIGRTEEARRLLNLADFFHEQLLPTPAGWDRLDAFNSALAGELSLHPGLRFGRHGTASHETWRIDAPATGAAPAARALLAGIGEAVRRQVVALGDEPHPWLIAGPDQATLASWCVMTGPEGFEDWHTHPNGWLSGVYYAEVPEEVSGGADEAGCLVLGLPEGLVGRKAAERFGRRLVRPRSGLLALFPSHAYHRTYPHRSHSRRICISFDVVPA